MIFCKYGHDIEYTPGSDSCRQCKRDRYIENRDAILAKMKAAYRADPAAVLEKNKVWFKDNPAKVKEISRRHQKRHPDSVLANTRKYQLRKSLAMPKWLNPGEIFEIQCMYKLSKIMEFMTGVKHHVDHEIPLNGDGVCGLHVPWNISVITAAENIAKSNTVVA